jgi:hypothetical protein
MWQGFDTAEVLSAGLASHELALREEQSVRGLDALKELQLHELLAHTCARAGFGVLREVGFPTLHAATRHSARPRCDIVLTPMPDQVLIDTLDQQREQTDHPLFSNLAPRTPQRKDVDPRECLWIEVKTVAQFAYTHGVPGPNRNYASELVQALRTDLDKLAADPAIDQGVVVLVLFTDNQRTARNDVVAAANRCLDHAAAIASMSSRSFPITDRAGNACCTVAAFDVLK